LGGLFGGGGFAPGWDTARGGGVDFLAGYATTGRSAVADVTAVDQLFGAWGAGGWNLRHQFPVKGVWLALYGRGAVTDQLGFYAGGTWLVPTNNGRTDATYTYMPFFPVAAQTTRNWSILHQWYTLEGGATYSLYGAFAVIGGFRFDSLTTNITDPEDDVVLLGQKTDEADFRFTAYIPYVGVALSYAPSVRLGVIGFPWFAGNGKYDETFFVFAPSRAEARWNFRTSQFLEIYADYSRDLYGGSLGIFGKWTWLHSEGTATAGAVPAALGVLPVDFRVSIDRQIWIFGGRFAVNFTSPI